MRLIERFPTPKEFNELRKSAEWPTFEEDLIEVALKHTLYVVVAEDDNGEAIGMGRIIGDCAIYMHIQDVIVIPGYQRRGIGEAIMMKLMEYVTREGKRNTNIGLMCSKGREGFYRKFGFVERPNERFGSGMINVLD